MIIGLTGINRATGKSAGSGKDTLADYAIESKYGKSAKFTKIALGDKLKVILSEIFGIPLEDFYSQEGKRKVVNLYDPRTGKLGTTIRRLMQHFGTDVMRSYDPNFWNKQVIKDANNLLKDHTLVICTDVRFLNEAEFLRNNGAKIVLIEALGFETAVEAENHSSEEMDWVDEFDFDFKLINEYNKDIEAKENFLHYIIRERIHANV